MRLKHFLSVFLTLLTLSVGQMWGANVSITASDLSGMGSSNYAEGEKTVGDFTISATGCYGTTQFRITQNKTLTITCNTGTMTAITFTTSGTYTLTATNLTNQAWSDTNGQSSVSFTQTRNGAARITNIAITYSSSCSNKVTLTKGLTTNGTFDLDQKDGSYDNCDDNFVVHVSNIVPANNAQYCNGINVTGGNSNVTGPVDGVWTVTYTKGNNLSSTITPTYANKTAASISFENAGTPAPTTSGYYVGDTYKLPSTNNFSCSGGKTFVGWSTVDVAETNTKPASNFYEPGADVTLAASQTFHAVFAIASSGSGTTTAAITQTALKNGISGTQAYGDDASSINDNQNKTWHIKANSQTTGNYRYIQMRIYNNNSGVSYIQLPTFPGNISSITLTVSSNSGNNPTAGGNSTTLYLCSNADANVDNPLASASGTSSITLTPTSNVATGYIKAGGGIRIWDISATYSNVTYSKYSTTCCTELGQINGSFSFTNVSETGATAQWEWDDKGTEGISKNILKVYDNADDSEPVKTIDNILASATSQAITGLTPCKTYYVTLTSVASEGYCAGEEQEGAEKETFTTNGWAVHYEGGDETEGPLLSNVNKKTGDDEACVDADYVATFEANAGFALPETITVVIGSEKTAGTDYSWEISNGVGTLTIAPSKIEEEIEVRIIGEALGCTADPTIGAASLSGTYSNSAVGVTVSGCSTGSADCAWTDYGFVWGTSANPTVTNDTHTTQVGTDGNAATWSGSLAGSFSTGVEYHFRAYGKNSKDEAAYAYGADNTFTLRSVTFKDGATTLSTVYLNNGGKVAAPAENPSKTGYNFTGWKLNSAAYDFDGTVSSDLELQASWEEQNYSITKTFTGCTASSMPASYEYTGSGSDFTYTIAADAKYVLPAEISVTMGGEALTLNTDYTWNSGSGALAISAVITGNLVIMVEAERLYSVTLMDLDADNTLTQATVGGNVTLPTRKSCEGYTFAGWSTTYNANWNTTAPTIIPADDYVPTEDVDLYPVYTKTEQSGSANTYNLVTSANDLGDGDNILIVSPAGIARANQTDYPYNAQALSTEISGNTRLGGTEVTISENSITTTTATVFTLSGNSTDGYKIHAGNKYLYGTAKNGMSTTETVGDALVFPISIADAPSYKATIGNVTLGSDACHLDFNPSVSSGNVNKYFALYTSNYKGVYIYKSSVSSTTSYISVSECCDELATLDGGVTLTNEGCAAGELKATWKSNSEGLAGISSQVLHIYKASNNDEVLAKKVTGLTASTSNQTQTISGLDICETYYVKVENISAGKPWCASDFAGEKSDNATTKGYSYSFTLTGDHVTKKSGTERAHSCEGDIMYTFEAVSGYVLPTSIIVTNAGDENDNWMWDSSTGELLIYAEGVEGNVSVTISATVAPCDPMANPSVSIEKTYNGATLSWSAIDHAAKYKVYIYNNDNSDLESDENVSGTSYTIGSTLTKETTYKYRVDAVSTNEASYCSSYATGTFETPDYPSVTLYYSENGTLSEGVSQKILTDFELANPETDPCEKKFVGWSEVTVAETDDAPDMMLPGATYQISTNANCTIYAVYATATPGEATNVFSEDFSSIETGENTSTNGSSSQWTPNSNFSSTKNNVYQAGGAIRLGKTGSLTTKSLDLSSGEVTVTLKLKGWSATENTISVQVDEQTTQSASCTGYMTTGNFESKSFTFNAGTSNSVVKFTTDGNTRVFVDDIVISVPGDPTYSAYATTCVAAPVATANASDVAELVDVDAAGVANGTIAMTYENVDESAITVGVFTQASCQPEDAAPAEYWLTASPNGDKNIAYTIAENTSYNDARTAYIKLTAPETTDATDPAVVIIPVSQTMKPAVFSSLQALAEATINANTEVTVSFENVPIKEFYYYPETPTDANKKGIVFNIQKAGSDIKIYFTTAVPNTWVTGGKVSGTLTNCPWKTYDNKWQLAPKTGWEWTSLTYTAPPAIESVEIRGTASKTTYIDGQVYDPAGLSVYAIYDNDDEEDVTEYVSWTYSPATLSTSDDQVTATAEYNSKSDSKTIDVTVNPIPDKTIAQFIAAGGTRCYLEGIVSNLTNATKGYFDITDATGTLHIYGCDGSNAAGVANGDKVKLIAEVYELYGEPAKPEAKNTQYVSHISPVAITITDAGSLSVEKDQTLTINATTDPEGAAANITYNVKAGSEDYASVEGNVVTGLAKGTATIIASIPAGEGYLANSVEFEVEVIEYYSITYEENGGSVVADVAKALELPDPLPETTRENYTFNGWFTNEGLTEPAEAGAVLANNVTLYAKWTEIPLWARTYTSNVTLVGGGNSFETNSYVSISGETYEAKKVGTGEKTGTISITVPAGTNAVHFHGFAWNNKSVSVSVAASPAVTNLSESSFTLAGDAAGSGSGTYTINSDPVVQYNSFTFDAVEAATTFTFSKSSGTDNRFIIYGVNAIFPEITLDPEEFDFENVRAGQNKTQEFTITANANVSGTLSASIIDDENGKYSVTDIENGKVTVTFAPGEAESGTFEAKLKVWATNALVTADLTGTAIAALAPEITVDKNAIDFGRVNPNASVSEDITIGLLNIEGSVSAALSGDDAEKFALSAYNFTEDGVLKITPVTTTNGIFSTTLKLTATDADDVEIPVSITVASKWAVTYTSNVTITSDDDSKKVTIAGEDYNTAKANKASWAKITLPKNTSIIHLHLVAWKDEAHTVTVSGDCFNSNKSLDITAHENVSGSGNKYDLGTHAISYYFTLTPEKTVGNNEEITLTAATNKRFVLFGVNQEGGIVEIADNTNASALPSEVNVEVKDGKTLTINEDKEFDNLTVKAGGTVTTTNALEVKDLFLESKSGASGQISNASNLDVTGDLYMDVTLYTSASGLIDADYWYSVAVPFDVDINSGIYRLDGTTATQLHNSADFDVWYYDTEYRASSQRTGWKRLNGKMEAGKAYLIGFDEGMSNKVRFKAAEGWKDNLFTGDNLSLVYDNQNSGEHANWNGIANPTMHYMGSDEDVQVFDNDLHTYSSFNKFNYVVGTAFFVKATSESFAIGEVDANNEFRAPKRESENKYEFSVRICKGEAERFDNQMYVRASEEASAEFDANRDITTMNSATAPSAMLWTENYGGKRLAIENAPIVNNTASYVLGLYAPKAGQYRIEATDSYNNADLYLTYEGSIIWNLSMGEYEIELAKGATNGYGLLLQAKAPQVVTGVDEVDAETGVQKIIIDEHVFVLRGGQMYDVTGKTVK